MALIAPISLLRPQDDFPWASFWFLLGLPTHLAPPHTGDAALLDPEVTRLSATIRAAGVLSGYWMRKGDGSMVGCGVEIRDRTQEIDQIARLPQGLVALSRDDATHEVFADWCTVEDYEDDPLLAEDAEPMELSWLLCYRVTSKLALIASGELPPVEGWEQLASVMVAEYLGHSEPHLAKWALHMVSSLPNRPAL
jgi:hypothetical protein